MKTDQLIDILSKDEMVTTPKPVSLWFLGGAMVLIAFTLFLHFGLGMGIRPNYFQVISEPVVFVKQALPLLLFVFIFPAIKTLSFPEGEYKTAMLWPISIYALCMSVLLLFAWWSTPSEQVSMDVIGKSRLKCLVSIPVYSWVVMGFAFYIAKKSAPTNPRAFAIATALASSALATVIYALGCIEDSPLFYALWYNLAILIAVAVGGYVGYRWIKW